MTPAIKRSLRSVAYQLTRELRIRSVCRDDVDWDVLLSEIQFDWDALLSEIQFVINVTPDDMSPAFSPFQLVHGHKPRMSARDITFPNHHITPRPKHLAPYVKAPKKLQSLWFVTLDKQIECKEQLRASHDRNRTVNNAPTPKRDDIV